jgi:TatA/E family protein of Tat protein translocase
MEGIGLTEVLFIAAIALLIFGTGKFAALGKGLSEGIKNFKASVKEGEDEQAKEKSKEVTTGTEKKS